MTHDPLTKLAEMQARAQRKRAELRGELSCWPCEHYRTVSGAAWCQWRQTHAVRRCEGYSYEPGSDEAERGRV